MASFGTYFLGFAIRPLGGILFGSLGDRLGRKFVLLATVMLMGVSSTLIGLLPTFATLGYVYFVLLLQIQDVRQSWLWRAPFLASILIVGVAIYSYIVEAVGLKGRVGALRLACAAAVSVVVTPLVGFLTDRYGRVFVYRAFAIFQLLTAFPVWWVLSQGNLISTLIAGGLAPLVGAGIIAWVSHAHGGQPGAGIGAWVGIAAYLALLTLGTVLTTFITPEPKGRDLDDPRDAVQGQTITLGTT